MRQKGLRSETAAIKTLLPDRVGHRGVPLIAFGQPASEPRGLNEAGRKPA
jgi:hypothetical protein